MELTHVIVTYNFVHLTLPTVGPKILRIEEEGNLVTHVERNYISAW